MSAESESPSLNPAVRYRELVSECNQLMNKVADLESDLVEHSLVEDTLKPLDGGRRAYRLVGDVLVERTVAEVLPSITKNKENVGFCGLAVVCFLIDVPAVTVCRFLLTVGCNHRCTEGAPIYPSERSR
jgi:hypothetical protein